MGNPDDIVKWLKEKYDIKMELEGDYAIATVLAILLDFKKRAEFKVIKNDEEIEFGGGLHENCDYFEINDGSSGKMFKLNVKNEDFDIFVSESPIDTKLLNHPLLFKKKIVKGDRKVHLTLPMVKYEEECDFSAAFKGSFMRKIDNATDYEIEQVKTVTKLDLGLDKVEIKQVAAITMVVSGCISLDLSLRHTISDNYFIYILYKGNLLFGSKMLKEDFIKGDELERIKKIEALGNENAQKKHDESLKLFSEKYKK